MKFACGTLMLAGEAIKVIMRYSVICQYIYIYICVLLLSKRSLYKDLINLIITGTLLISYTSRFTWNLFRAKQFKKLSVSQT